MFHIFLSGSISFTCFIHATLLSTWWYFAKDVSQLRPINRRAEHTVLLPRHKSVPITNVSELFQTGWEKSIAKGDRIDRMAGDRNGITSWKFCVRTDVLRQIFHFYQFFYVFFCCVQFWHLKRARLEYTEIFNLSARLECQNCTKSRQIHHDLQIHVGTN